MWPRIPVRRGLDTWQTLSLRIGIPRDTNSWSQGRFCLRMPEIKSPGQSSRRLNRLVRYIPIRSRETSSQLATATRWRSHWKLDSDGEKRGSSTCLRHMRLSMSRIVPAAIANRSNYRPLAVGSRCSQQTNKARAQDSFCDCYPLDGMTEAG